jgi:hypothetical protein
MVQFATHHQNDVCIIVIGNKHPLVPKIRYMSRASTIGYIVAMFARGAARCMVHSTVVQNVSFMQPYFLGQRLDALPYALCSRIVLGVEDCDASYRSQLPSNCANQKCVMNDLNMCAVHRERITHVHAVPVVAVPMHAAYTQTQHVSS